MQCNNCGTHANGNLKFCGKCGASTATANPNVMPAPTAPIKNTYGGKFCSPNEMQITTLGSGYVANFLSGGGVSQAGATLTNKRIYFSGTNFMIDEKGKLTTVSERKIVNVRDVTGVGYKHFKSPQYLFYAIMAVICGIVGVVLTMETQRIGGMGAGGTSISQISSFGYYSIVAGLLAGGASLYEYIKSIITLLSVEYAGGNIAFDARWLQAHEKDVFIRNIHLAKDKLYSVSAEAQGFTDKQGN